MVEPWLGLGNDAPSRCCGTGRCWHFTDCECRGFAVNWGAQTEKVNNQDGETGQIEGKQISLLLKTQENRLTEEQGESCEMLTGEEQTGEVGEVQVVTWVRVRQAVLREWSSKSLQIFQRNVELASRVMMVRQQRGWGRVWTETRPTSLPPTLRWPSGSLAC